MRKDSREAKRGNRVTSWEIVTTVQVREDDDLVQCGSSASGDWVMYIFLKVEQIGFADRLDDDVKERGSMMTKGFALSNWRNGVTIYSN